MSCGIMKMKDVNQFLRVNIVQNILEIGKTRKYQVPFNLGDAECIIILKHYYGA